MVRPPLPAETGARLDGVDAVLDGFFSVATRRAASLGSEYVELWTVLERSTARGKHFRPRLVLTAYEALGGADHRAASTVGAAFELLHAALLVHDDVIDRDFFRRGIPNVSGSYRDSATTAGIPTPIAEHRGRSAAIIAGDRALAGASRLFDALECQDGVRARLREIFDEAIFESAGGEMLDVEMSLSEEMPTVENILRVGRAKTAVYSFEAPLQSGAVLAHASDAVVRALGDFGRELGVAYQVVDDLLGVFGSEHLTGKSTLSDLREGKRTVLVAHAATTDAWFSIKPFIGKSDLDEREAEHVRGRLEICGARAFAEGLVQEHARRARAVLGRPMIDTALRDAVNPMIDAVLDRAR